MPSFIALSFTLLAIISSAPATTTAEEFKVGGADGWRQPAPNESEMYSQWAQTMRFHVGDSLRFEYKNDTVMVVDKFGYYHCNSTRPASVFKDGNTVIKLERPGPAYFVSSDPDHCKNGQRLMVDVATVHPSTRSPGSPAPSPYSGAKAFVVVPHVVLIYAIVIVVSIN